ncbi:MAG: HAMP domain-containing histidine kinase [Clostridiales bacterium]|nr:HAMP domain-containing histidine kinase [Clostridiales bacterium]
MIRKLRVKFIAMSMLSLLVVLLAIMGSVNLVNYQGIVEDADQVLDILVDNNGSFPRQESQNQKQGDGSAPPSDGGLGGLRELSPELPYESRYFSVLLNSEGEVETVDTGKIAAVDTSAAIEYAQEAVSRGAERGFLSDYRYAITSDESGTRVIFLDCGRNLSTFYSFLKASCGISAVGLAAVLLLMVLFSGRIIRPVAESYDKQRRFITDAGHELKTPLTIIDADAEVLEMDIGENEWLQDIRRQTDRLAKLTGALIALSRMEEGEEQFQMIDFPISDVVGETAQSFQALAKTQNKRFESRIQPMLTLHGDENAIRQITGILLDNALKYSPEGGEIVLTLEQSGRNLRLLVRNTAEGVTQESLEHIFDRFYRGDPSRSSARVEGHGIGLSIAQMIVNAHKGRIAATLQNGDTLLMTVTLPL